MEFSGKIEDGISNKPINFRTNPWPWRGFVFVCLLTGYSKSYERVSTKFSGKIEDSTSNKSLNFDSDPWPVCRSVSILLENI